MGVVRITPEPIVLEERAKVRIGPLVEEFCRTRIGATFYLTDLLDYVRARTQTAPNSPARILQILRKKHRLDYLVINRSQSFYRVLSVAPRQSTQMRLSANRL